MNQEPFQIVPVEKWPELQAVCLGDWPRSLPGYNALDTQYRWYKDGMKHDFKVYSLFGNLSNGFVAVNNKVNNYELVIQYPKDDTNTLEKALTTTKIINWDNRITFTFISYQAAAVVQKVVKDKNVVLDFMPMHTFIIEKGSPLFEDASLPHGFTFEPLTSKHIDIIDLKWPHRYPLSPWYFQLLIDSKSGYGLYKTGAYLLDLHWREWPSQTLVHVRRVQKTRSCRTHVKAYF